jgi:flagellar biosynthesis GTPase FlhF
MNLARPLSVSWADLADDGKVRPSAKDPRPAPLASEVLSVDELVGLTLEPGSRDVAERLLAHGASSDFTRLVLASVRRSGASGAYALDAAAEVLGRLVPILPSPKRPHRGEPVPLFAFVGPTGVGKTSSLVKLGRRLRAAGRKVVFASLDPLSLEALERVGGLASDVDRGEIPLELVRDAADVKRLIARARGVDAVVLDTPGTSPRAEERLDELARELARLAGGTALSTLLVLAATAGRGALRLTTSAFARFHPAGAVLTKLDETDEPAAAYEALVRANLAAAFLCDGQDTRAHLARPTNEALAALVLRGHLPGSEHA